MTLGDGIFYSTLLLVVAAAFHQISVRHRWKLVAKALGPIAALAAVTAAGAWWWERFQARPQAVFALDGVRLGMAPVDVRVRLGEPEHRLAGGPNSSFSAVWLSKIDFADESQFIVMFSRDGATSTADRICKLKPHMPGDATSLLGFGWHSTEEQIIERLGPPTTVSVNQPGTEKLMSYDQLNVVFGIKKGGVARLCVSSIPAMRYEVEYQAIVEDAIEEQSGEVRLPLP